MSFSHCSYKVFKHLLCLFTILPTVLYDVTHTKLDILVNKTRIPEFKNVIFGPLLGTDFLTATHGALLVLASLFCKLNRLQKARFCPHLNTLIQDPRPE